MLSGSDLATLLFHLVLGEPVVRHLGVPRDSGQAWPPTRQGQQSAALGQSSRRARDKFISKIDLNFGPFSLALASLQAQGQSLCITI